MSQVSVIRPSSSACSASLSLPRFTRPVGGVLEVLAAPRDGLVVDLDADHGEPVAGEHLGDPGTHGAEADHADGVEGPSGGGRGGLREGARHARHRVTPRRGHGIVSNFTHRTGRSITTRTPLRSRPSPISCSCSRRWYGAGSRTSTKPEAGVERPVPRQVAVGAQRHRVVPRAAGLLQRRLDEGGADPPPSLLRRHRELLEVGVTLDVQHVGETHDPRVDVGDQEEAGQQGPVDAGRAPARAAPARCRRRTRRARSAPPESSTAAR